IRDRNVTGVQTCALPISNIEFNEHALNHIWRMADDVDTQRGLLVSTADALTTGEAALKTFRRYYAGKSEDIEVALVHDWSRDPRSEERRVGKGGRARGR